MDEQQKIELVCNIFRDATRDSLSATSAKRFEKNLQKLGQQLLGRPLREDEVKVLCESAGFLW